MDFLRQLYQQFLAVWRSLSLQQKIFVSVGFAIVFVGLLSIALWQTSPEYTVLFSNLQERDAAEIVESLREAGVPYKLSSGGATVLVPYDRVAETRLSLAQEGLPKGGGVGYEIFDRTRLGITGFEQRVNLKRAMEGELSRTINQLAEVRWSRVQIVMPEERLFTEEQEPPTASVFLNLEPGRTLDRRQIQGIQHLVASSVEGLRPEKITILDQYANPLAMPTEPIMAATDLSSSQFELRSRVERHFHSKIKSMFDRIVGPGKSVVSVSVDLDFDKIERTEERYDPDSAVVRSEQRQRETTSTPTARAEGVAGVSANLPTAAPMAQAVLAAQKQSSSTITNFEISKTVEHIIESPSSIKEVSVAVVVDGTYRETTSPEGETIREYVPRNEEELEKYRRMVLAAVGGNPTARNVEVINVPMQAPPSEEMEEVPIGMERELYLEIAKGAITVVMLLLIFLFVRYILKRILSAAPVRPPEEGIGARIDLFTKETTDMTGEVKSMVRKKPEDAAALIKVWLKEEK
ncbi:MAG: flagellar basal-body MS-ring/collar protein FliF [Candidatus Abyssubacteria bacterium]